MPILTSPDVIARVRDLRSKGLSIDAICHQCHVSTHTVVRCCLDVVVPPRVKAARPIKPVTARPTKPPKPIKTARPAKPPKPMPVVPGIFDADIARLRQRERQLEAGVLASTRAKSQLIREVIAGLENAQARAAIRRGRRATVRVIPRNNDITLEKFV